MTRTLSALPILFAIAAAGTAQGQDLRFGRGGSSLLLGEVSLSYSSGTQTVDRIRGDLPSTFQLMVGPQYGYFVIDGLMLGLVVDYTRTTVDDGTTETTDNGLLLGLRPAYYLALLPSRALSIYFRGLLGYALRSQESVTSNDVTKTSRSGFAGGAGAGIAFGFGAIWGGVLQIGIDYTYFGLTSDADSAGSRLNQDEHVIWLGTGIGVYF